MSSDRQLLQNSHRVLLWLLCLVPVLLLPLSSNAHEIRPSIVDLSLDQAVASIEFRVNLEAVLAEIGSDHEDTDDSPSVDYYNSLRAMDAAELKLVFDTYIDTFLNNVSITDNAGETLSLQLKALDIPAVGDIQIARDSSLTLQTSLADDVTAVSLSWAPTYGALILRAGSESTDNLFNQYLQPGDTSDFIQLGGQSSTSWLSTAKNYFVVGFIHIVPKGLDHILFVIGLFLLSPYWRAIVLQVSAFTVAHTITLALGMTGYLQVSASIVEPLIALSIAVVCLENVFTAKLKRWRLIVVILFGLLHGLGFAGVLSEIGFSSGMFLTSLLSFNIGVEAGQLLVIFVCFVLVGWPFRKKHWYRKALSLPASIALSVVGTVWFVQRIAM